MTNYLATPFHGDRHDEDPSEFLSWFLQYMGKADKKMKARNFIYYLQADSLADEWFEELGEEEKGSWDVIEVLFRKKWLKEEELGIKDPAAVENKPHSSPITSNLVNKTEIKPQITPNQHNEPPATSQSPTLAENGKNAKINTTSTRATTCEISQIFDVFSRSIPSITVSNSPALSTATTALETHPKASDFAKNLEKATTSEISPNTTIFLLSTSSVTPSDSTTLSTTTTAPQKYSEVAVFSQKLENIEIPPFITKTAPETPSLSITEPINDVTQVHASPNIHNGAVLEQITVSTGASSLQDPEPPPSTGHGKCTLMCAVFESQAPMEFPVHTSIITSFETRPATAGFMNIHQKLENSYIYPNISPESLVSGHFNWEINTESLPTQSIAPTKHPCDPSTGSSYFSW